MWLKKYIFPHNNAADDPIVNLLAETESLKDVDIDRIQHYSNRTSRSVPIKKYICRSPKYQARIDTMLPVWRVAHK